MIRITGLYTYPIKSCGGLSHQEIKIEKTGPAYDRHWVITDSDGMFITQRDYPRMTLIQPQLTDDALVITAPGMGDMCVALQQQDAMRREVTVWRDTVTGADEGDDVAAWLSEFLKTDVRLFAMPQTTVRNIPEDFNNGRPAQVSFADGFPMLVISEESLEDLNEKLAERGKRQLPMRNFRPNMVIQGGGAFVEDTWKTFQAGEIPFEAVKACARCVMTTVNYQTGEIADPKEPLATLATYRKAPHGVIFGQNIVHRAEGMLAIGDVVRG